MSASPAPPDRLAPIAERVAAVCPDLVDPFEATALVESFGYTDSLIREEFGEPDSRSVGEAVFARLRGTAAGPPQASPAPTRALVRLAAELRVLAHTCSLSLIYSLPWIGTFVFERRYPSLMQVPPEAAAPLGVALMASLIVAGGFVQCIARKGGFYAGLGQPSLGREVCMRIWRLGAAAATVIGATGVALALYVGMFEPRYLLLAAVHFAGLTLLWMTCAILLLREGYWQVPAAFVAGVTGFWASHHAGASALASQGAAIATALASALLIAGLTAPPLPPKGSGLAAPRYAVFARSLAPYFLYGVGYFAFVFADRLAAGTAVATSAGVQFAIEPEYKLGMDISLLLFLLSMTTVEYINHDFMRFWQNEATRWTPLTGPTYRARLRHRYAASRAAVAGGYLLVFGVIWLLLDVPALADTPRVREAMALGVIGYLLLELALFNALVLFTVSAATSVLRALGPALLVNAGAGYVLSNMFGPVWAAAALVAGACIFLWHSGREVRVALERPGYCCYVS